MDIDAPLSDAQFLADVEACRLPAQAFGHRAHLRLAWLYLQRHPLDQAIERTCEVIARFATHHGATAKFHRTLTEALVRLMAAGGASDPRLPHAVFRDRNPHLWGDVRELLTQYYSPQRLATPEARLRFILPDREPLPR